ncbi:VWA domain-containing protein [Pelomonas sp. SE-A7]|uniref:vWA domain-containing protein n=1 Tax=Pelomonas sp. SE-A7 TaxID=3054953 RepID=UPI00259C92C8|nr:VWA domain-containing protein [Pelomonas sp. SE-A7]MDM4764999.1 VWA domain-containing protein [Pelomonas sp. SE-A7]
MPPPSPAPRRGPVVESKVQQDALQRVEITGNAPVAMPSHSFMPAPARVALPPPANTAKYENFSDNPWRRVAEHPTSTFSASVDTGSYANVRRFIGRGQLPPRDAVRVEELVNYFGYDYAEPPARQEQPFTVDAKLSRSPWNHERGLLRIAIKARDAAKASLPPANLVFLVDVSGSMSPQDRLPLVKSALGLLAQQLRPQDRLSIVSYASGTRLVLPATPGNKKTEIQLAIDSLSAGGGTYGEAGIRMAYAQAREAFIDGGINRVLLATDGDLNIGVVDPAQLKALVEEQRKAGVGLTALGVGDSNYNEALMKKLADAGDGSYHYMDSLQEAHKVLVNEMTSTLAVVAQDLKLQVEFNPGQVDEYRLIGYELNALTREQFKDDKVDAGDVGAGHTVTALYEWVPRGARGNVDPLRYQPSPTAAKADGKSGELAWIKLRYKKPGQADSQLVEFGVARPAQLPGIEQADPELRFAAAVAGWGQWLRGSTLIGEFGPQQVLTLARESRGSDRYGHRAEFLRLAELSAALKR